MRLSWSLPAPLLASNRSQSNMLLLLLSSVFSRGFLISLLYAWPRNSLLSCPTSVCQRADRTASKASQGVSHKLAACCEGFFDGSLEISFYIYTFKQYLLCICAYLYAKIYFHIRYMFKYVLMDRPMRVFTSTFFHMHRVINENAMCNVYCGF